MSEPKKLVYLMMEFPVLLSELCYGADTPFPTYHRIFFKPDSISRRVFGEFLLGKFVFPSDRVCDVFYKEGTLFIDIMDSEEPISIALRLGLYFKGVPAHDIDFGKTYPGLN